MNKNIDGKELSLKIKNEVKEEVATLKEKGLEPCLAVVLVGNDVGSKVYVKNKINACEYCGIKSVQIILPEETTEEELKLKVGELAEDKTVHGILVQLPLPKHINEQNILKLIPAKKDADGFHSENVGNLVLGNDTIKSCTPSGIIELIKYAGIEISGKNAVVIGRSNIVGKPVSVMLLNENATVTICHSKTIDLKKFTKDADILVVAIGRAKFVKKYMVKEGAVVIDVGMNRDENGLCGDVDYDDVYDVVSRITPVPGGVGPMTIAMLMKNTVIAAKRQSNI